MFLEVYDFKRRKNNPLNQKNVVSITFNKKDYEIFTFI